MPTETPTACIHGSLRRSCDICERDSEIERLSRELLEAKEFERKACLGIAERWMICEAIGATNVAREIAVAIRARSVLSPNKDSETAEIE